MDVAQVNFHVLDVGQGACNYVEIVDEAGDVIHNMLIDLGTNSSQAIATDNIEWLKEQIKDRADPRIDVVVLTHGDTDHFNLMMRLLPALNPASTDRIGMVRYGGVAWRYMIGKTSLIDELEKYCDDVNGFTPTATSYDDGDWEPIWPDEHEDGDVTLNLIIANTPHAKDPVSSVKRQKLNAEAVNTKSVVLGVEWDEHWVVATGDATATTIARINKLLKDVTAADLPTTFMLTLPHHGSRKTTYDLTAASDKPSDEDVQIVDKFLETFEPLTLSISAGEKRHHHPSMLMVEQFSLYTDQDVVYWSDPELTDEDRHFLTCWIDLDITGKGVDPRWPSQPLYAATQTSQNVYSTLYFKSDPYNREYIKLKPKGKYFIRYECPPLPAESLGGDSVQEDVPLGRNWEFSMTDKLSVESTENEARAAAESAELATAPKAPPPSFTTAPGRNARLSLAAATAPVAFAAKPAPSFIGADRQSIFEPAAPQLRSLKAIP